MREVRIEIESSLLINNFEPDQVGQLGPRIHLIPILRQYERSRIQWVLPDNYIPVRMELRAISIFFSGPQTGTQES